MDPQSRKTQSAKGNRVRLNKFISESGLASRRKADELIDSGVVAVNGKFIRELGTQINPYTDLVTVKGKRIGVQLNKRYFVLHKPTNVITSLDDPLGRPTISDYLRKIRLRVFPVGRLDWNTEGLLIITNDGDYAHRVLHPSYNIVKTYIAKLDGNPTDDQLAKLKRGFTIVGGRVKAVDVKRMDKKKSDKYTWVQISIIEGKNQQVRKMFEKIGYSVKRLKRIAVGHLKLGSLKLGEIRELTPEEAKKALF